MIHHATDHTALFTTYGGVIASVTLYDLRISELGVIVSALVAVLGFSVHVWITVKRNRREQELFNLQMELLRHGTKATDAGAGP